MLTVSLAAMLAAAALAAPASAKRSSLYDGPAPRPGPDLLYAKPPKPAPQLLNRGPWEAGPILVSGASAYRKGEFVYQDFIYDDHGARGSGRDSNDPRSGSDTFSAPNGTYTYPRDPVYMDNAADLVELRVKPLAGETAFRITLNALADPERTATTIAIGDSAEPAEVPHGANARMPAEYFLTVHGREAELAAASGEAPPRELEARASTRRNQFEVRVPNSLWNPRSRTVRLAAGVGLWDPDAGTYLIPGEDSSETFPGGAGGISDPPAFFNLAFRYDEPLPVVVEALSDPAWWRDKGQAEALGSGDLSRFHADVDFGMLRHRVQDQMHDEPGGTPTTGPLNRILVSRYENGEGASWARGCGDPDDCLGELSGRLQPYSVYVPDRPRVPHRGFGTTLLLHSLGAGYNQFTGTRNQSQFGERGKGSLVITPSGRGPDGWYYGHAGADTFEVWADVARHYHLDPDFTSISGYSMGGYGTYKFATQYPDLFARANPVVGPPGLGIWVPPNEPTGGAASNTNRMLASVRHVPFTIWNGAADELVPAAGPVAQAQTFDDLGYRYEFRMHSADHLLLAINDQYAPAAEFLGSETVDRNPHHVSYVVNPTMDFPGVKSVADHAYWLSGLRLRDRAGEAPLGEVDAVSRGFGVTDPEPQATRSGGGSLEGGDVGPIAYTEQAREWSEPGRAPARDVLEVTATNLSTITVHPKRAKLGCGAELDVDTDGPLTVALAGCGRHESFG